MLQSEARFVTAASLASALPPPMGPEVVFSGRSNVGKSSLINAVVGRRGLARVSRTPGRTQQINFFDTGSLGILVDLPGYGFARAPAAVRAAWKPLVDGYLGGRRPVAICLLLVDARHPPSSLDIQMMEWLRANGLPTQVVLTKADAVPASRRRPTLLHAAAAMGIEEGSPPPLPVSARAGLGIAEMRTLIHRAVSA